jgi:hypothetical protein
MGEASIIRRLKSVPVTLSTSTSSATTIRLDNAAGAIVSLGTLSTSSSSLHVYGCDTVDGTYRRLYDYAGSPANVTLQPSSSVGTMYSFPDAAFALPYAKLVSGDTHSTGVSGVVTFKS